MALSFANKVTIGRIVIVPVFIVTILSYSSENDFIRFLALGIFLIAVISDVIDGFIARTRHQKTTAGAILDPLADKLLLISAFICLYKLSGELGEVVFPLWVILVFIFRDFMLLIGSMIIYLVHGQLKITPTKWGKITTFLQIVSIIGVLLQWPMVVICWMTAVVLTIISGFGYIRKGVKILNVPSGRHN